MKHCGRLWLIWQPLVLCYGERRETQQEKDNKWARSREAPAGRGWGHVDAALVMGR